MIVLSISETFSESSERRNSSAHSDGHFGMLAGQRDDYIRHCARWLDFRTEMTDAPLVTRFNSIIHLTVVNRT